MGPLTECSVLGIMTFGVIDTDEPSGPLLLPLPGNRKSGLTNIFYYEVLSTAILYYKSVRVFA